MEILNQEGDAVVLRLTHDEVIAFSNALNESLENLDEWEFETRMGVSKVEVKSMLSALSEVRVS